MKSVIEKVLVLIFSILYLTSCSSDGLSDAERYFRINSDPEDFMINYDYKRNQIITYKNQFGDNYYFTFTGESIEKRETLSLYSTAFFYDELKLSFKVSNTLDNESSNLLSYRYSNLHNNFKTGIDFSLWNGTQVLTELDFFDKNDFFDEHADINLTATIENAKEKMIIDGHEFMSVITAEHTIEKNDKNGHRIKKIYFDYDFGIIKFIDNDDNEWTLVYPN